MGGRARAVIVRGLRMPTSYRHARRLGFTRTESLRLSLLLARLSLHDPPTDLWGRPASWEDDDRRSLGGHRPR
jgi:hypothetical protein